MRIFMCIALLASTAAQAHTPSIPKRLQKIIAQADGLTPATAFKVSSVKQEYEIMSALGLKPHSQALIIKDKPFDKLTATDDAGKTREVWFDISSFYGAFY